MTEPPEGRPGCGQLRKEWLKHENGVRCVKFEMPNRLPESNTNQAGKTWDQCGEMSGWEVYVLGLSTSWSFCFH